MPVGPDALPDDHEGATAPATTGGPGRPCTGQVRDPTGPILDTHSLDGLLHAVADEARRHAPEAGGCGLTQGARAAR